MHLTQHSISARSAAGPQVHWTMQVEALVNNAAVMKYDWKKDSFDASYATNFEGPLQLTEKLVPHLKPGRSAGFDS